MPIELSVVIPVYNAEQSIKKLVNTIFNDLNQIKIEIILVNDGSKDKSD